MLSLSKIASQPIKSLLISDALPISRLLLDALNGIPEPRSSSHGCYHTVSPPPLAPPSRTKQTINLERYSTFTRYLHSSPLAQSNTRHNAGWTYDQVVNLPNMISMGRLLSGPVIASWIVQGQWPIALSALTVSGLSDWLDGYVARKQKIVSVLGSYLDPLADKVLIVSVVGALGYTGALPGPLVGVIIGRDVFLIAGAFGLRAKALGWKWPGTREFFRLAPSSSSSSDISSSSTSGEQGTSPTPAATIVQPLFISKVNTALQLALVGACMSDAWLGWPGQDVVWLLGGATAGTTLASCAAYISVFRNAKL